MKSKRCFTVHLDSSFGHPNSALAVLATYFQPQSRVRQLVLDETNVLHYSPVSLLEIQIKNAKGRADFHVDSDALLLGLHQAGIEEVPVTSAHALQVGTLPLLHKDPFDRLLLAQALVEDMTLLTTDAVLSRYPSHVLNVG